MGGCGSTLPEPATPEDKSRSVPAASSHEASVNRLNHGSEASAVTPPASPGASAVTPPASPGASAATPPASPGASAVTPPASPGASAAINRIPLTPESTNSWDDSDDDDSSRRTMANLEASGQHWEGAAGGCELAVGGSTYSLGAKLRCLTCGHDVNRFIDKRWSDKVDYFYFRNYGQVIEKLEEAMEIDKGAACYCCSCCWQSINIGAIKHLSEYGTPADKEGGAANDNTIKWTICHK